MKLPIRFPYPPMEAHIAEEIPKGDEWQYEPKWDGFRCLAFRDGEEVELQSKAGRPLTRYFPELVAALKNLKPSRFVLDGEIIIAVDGEPSFDELLQRIHPAASRVKLLSEQHPCLFIVFDLLVNDRGAALVDEPLERRRRELERWAKKFLRAPGIVLSPATRDFQEAKRWFQQMRGSLDGVIAKRVNLPYESGTREGMQKIKNRRTADCVIGGFRYGAGKKVVGSLLLGLYDDAGFLDHVGFTSAILGRGTKGDHGQVGGIDSGARIHGPRARRPEPLEQTGHGRLEAAGAEVGGGGGIRSLHRAPIPARNEAAALASGQNAAPVHDEASGARDEIGVVVVEIRLE